MYANNILIVKGKIYFNVKCISETFIDIIICICIHTYVCKNISIKIYTVLVTIIYLCYVQT